MMPACESLKTHQRLRHMEREVSRLRLGIALAVSRLEAHAEVLPHIATTTDALAALIENMDGEA